MAPPPVRTFSSALRSFRASRKINGVELAKLAGIPARSISRWERRRVRPRERDARKLIAVIATMNYRSAVELSDILEIPPPPDPSPPPPPPPPPEPVVIALPPPPPPVEKPAPPPVPGELAIDPVEAAVLRAAESLDMSPRLLRPVLARFLGHVASLGLTATEAATRVG
jgi:transcriptional regulator with XRE-family HTH domain